MFKPLMFLFLVFQLLPADAAPDAGGCAVPVWQLDIAGIKLGEPAAALQTRFPKAMPLSGGGTGIFCFSRPTAARHLHRISQTSFLSTGAAKSPAFL